LVEEFLGGAARTRVEFVAGRGRFIPVVFMGLFLVILSALAARAGKGAHARA